MAISLGIYPIFRQTHISLFPHWGRCIWQYAFPFTFRTTSRHIAEALASGNYMELLCLLNGIKCPKMIQNEFHPIYQLQCGAIKTAEKGNGWVPPYIRSQKHLGVLATQVWSFLHVSTLTWCDHFWKRSCEMYFSPSYTILMFKKTPTFCNRQRVSVLQLHILVHRPRLQSRRWNSGDSMPGISANGQACSKTFCV